MRKKKVMISKRFKVALVSMAFVIGIVVLFLVIDLDGDGLSNLAELQHGTAMFNSDTDSDGLNDEVEVNTYKTNPLAADSDGDGLNDEAEINTHGTDPLVADSDGDGLSDGQEVQLGTDPFNVDTDGDGLSDGSDPHPATHEWKLTDSDDDGWSDYKEYYETETDRFDSDTDDDGYSDPYDPNPLTHEWKLMDSDSDGWSDYKEYYETGTNRYSSDTDNDEAPDPYDPNPLTSARTIRRDYEWKYPRGLFGSTWTWTVNVSYDLYIYKSQLERIRDPHEWAIYTRSSETIKLAGGLESAAEGRYDYYETVDYTLAFVQSMPYTADDVTTGFDEYPRYPVETLVDGGGDCEDTSILTAAILDEMGYDVVLVLLPGHMAVGVWGAEGYPGRYYNWGGKRYYYCEATSEGWEMGDMPSSYQGVSATLIEV